MNLRKHFKTSWSTANTDSTTTLQKLHRKAHNGISLQYTDLVSNSKKVIKRQISWQALGHLLSTEQGMKTNMK